MWEKLASTLDTTRAFWIEIGSALPALIVATGLLFIGWIVARVVRRGVLRFLKLVRVDVLAEKTGVETFLLQGGVRYTAVTLLANLAYWLIMFTVILAALNTLGLQDAAAVFNRILLYVPNVIVALLVLGFGAFFAKIARAVTFTYLSNIGISGADIIGHLAQWAILLFVVSVVLEQLAIGGQIVLAAFQIGFGAICLALAIAFGMGGREWAAHVLKKLWKP